jgi:molybdopterin converting factor small subunit
MLKIINAKVLVSILAVLAAIAGVLVHEHQVNERNAAAAERTAAILAQQQREADAKKKADQDFINDVNRRKHQQNNMPANQGKTWRTYIP